MRTRYVAMVEVEAHDLSGVDTMVEALSEFEPSLSQVRSGLWQVRMLVRADGLAAACANAASVAQAVTGAPAVSAHVVSEHHQAQGAGLDTVPRQPSASEPTRRSAVGATRGQGDLNGVLAGTYRLRTTDERA